MRLAVGIRQLGRVVSGTCAVVVVCVQAVACLLPADVVAQSATVGPAEISGRVSASDGAAVGGVTVSLIGMSEMETDSSGLFRFVSLPAGTYFLRATRMGAKPVLKNVTVAADERVRVEVTLNSIAHQLTAIVVRADSAKTDVGDPTGFARRLRTEHGVFMTADQIEQRRAISTEQLFLAIPSVQVDTGGIVLINRGVISYKEFLYGHKNGPFGDQFVDCIGVQVFVDGVMMPQPFDVNSISPKVIRAIELYRGPATTPLELRSPKTVCGTLAIWTR